MLLVFRERIHDNRVSVLVHDGQSACGILEFTKPQWYSLRMILELSGGRFEFETATAELTPAKVKDFVHE